MPAASLPFWPSWTSGYVVVAVALAACLAVLIRRAYFHPLSKFPGPFLASATNLHKCWRYLQGNEHECYRNLHNKYGQSRTLLLSLHDSR